MKFRCSVTYAVVSPDNDGEYTDTGYELEDCWYDLHEIVNLFRRYGFSEPSSSLLSHHIWLSTVDPDINYQTGEHTYYTLHIDASTRNLKRIYKLGGVRV